MNSAPELNPLQSTAICNSHSPPPVYSPRTGTCPSVISYSPSHLQAGFNKSTEPTCNTVNSAPHSPESEHYSTTLSTCTNPLVSGTSTSPVFRQSNLAASGPYSPSRSGCALVQYGSKFTPPSSPAYSTQSPLHSNYNLTILEQSCRTKFESVIAQPTSPAYSVTSPLYSTATYLSRSVSPLPDRTAGRTSFTLSNCTDRRNRNGNYSRSNYPAHDSNRYRLAGGASRIRQNSRRFYNTPAPGQRDTQQRFTSQVGRKNWSNSKKFTGYSSDTNTLSSGDFPGTWNLRAPRKPWRNLQYPPPTV